MTSCLTITAHLSDGSKVGAHASLFKNTEHDGLESHEILPKLRDAIGDRTVTHVDVKGATGSWHPDYFDTSIEKHFRDGTDAPQLTRIDSEGLKGVIAQGLGRPRDSVRVQDVPDGTFEV